MASFDTWTLLLFGFVCYVIYSLRSVFSFLRKTYRSHRALSKFPSEKCHWLWGHLAVHPGANQEGLLKNIEWCTNNPRCYTVYVGPLRPVLFVNHPETAKIILKTAEPKATLGASGYTLLRPWLGDGLLLSAGQKWFRNRRLLTPGFHFDVLKPYMDIYNECDAILIAKFDRLSAQTGKSMDIFKPISLCTLDIILRCAFSTSRNVQEQGDNDPYVNTVNSIARLLVKRGLNPTLYLDSIYYRTKDGKRFRELCHESHDVAENVMAKRRKELASNTDEKRSKGRYVDFMDILLLARDEYGDGLTDLEIRDEVETFMFEGHDTTSSGISWILYNLARHPDIQSKARKEVDAILNGRQGQGKQNALLWDDMNAMPYLTMCIKESLRLHPPVHFISRQTTKPTTIDGKQIPADSLVNISIWNMHHNPTVWHDPMTYDPDRFLPENISKMDSYAFVPFSAGPRNCIGQTFAMNEMKTVVAGILRRFEFELDATKTVRMLPDVVLRAESGIHLHFKKRDV